MTPYNSGDAVALAVDNPKPGKSKHRAANYYTCFPIAEPLTDTFYKNAIASGSIIPPSGESASVRRTDYMVGLCVICLVVCGMVGFGVAYFWKG